LKDETVLFVDNPAHYPDPMSIVKGEEPYIRATLLMPERYLGAVMKLCMEKRGKARSIATSALVGSN